MTHALSEAGVPQRHILLVTECTGVILGFGAFDLAPPLPTASVFPLRQPVRDPRKSVFAALLQFFLLVCGGCGEQTQS